MSRLLQKIGRPLKNTGTASEWSACSINPSRLASRHSAVCCARFCTAAIDESLRLTVHLIPQSMSREPYRGSIPAGQQSAGSPEVSLLSNRFHVSLRWHHKSAAQTIKSRQLLVTRAFLRSFLHLFSPDSRQSMPAWSYDSAQIYRAAIRHLIQKVLKWFRFFLQKLLIAFILVLVLNLKGWLSAAEQICGSFVVAAVPHMSCDKHTTVRKVSWKVLHRSFSLMWDQRQPQALYEAVWGSNSPQIKEQSTHT